MLKNNKITWLHVFASSLFFLFSQPIFAASDQLQEDRINVIKRYVHLLGKGDYQNIPTLFTDHAVAVSANGESDSIDRFYESTFKHTFSNPQAKLINVFDGRIKGNMMTAYYNLSWVNKEGEVETSKFVDLFIFQADSTKIKTVFAFRNSFHEASLSAPRATA